MRWLERLFNCEGGSFPAINEVIAVFRKETLQILRTPGLISSIVWLPLVQVALLGLLDMNVHDLPTVVFDQARGPESRQLLRQMSNTGIFELVGDVGSRAALRDALRAGRASVGVELPPDFGQRSRQAGQTDFLVLIDGSDASVAAQALAAVHGLTLSRSLVAVSARGENDLLPLEASPVVLFSPDSRSSDLVIPGLIGILLLTSVANIVAFSIVGERERGTLDHIAMMPISRAAVLIGKLVPYLLLGIVQLVLILVVAAVLFQLPMNGSIASLLGASVLFLFAIIALALCVSTVTPNHIAATALLTVHFIPSVFISGYVFPVSSFPPAVQLLSSALPITHFIALARGIIIRGASLSELMFHAVSLAIIGALLFLLSLYAFRRATS